MYVAPLSQSGSRDLNYNILVCELCEDVWEEEEDFYVKQNIAKCCYSTDVFLWGLPL